MALAALSAAVGLPLPVSACSGPASALRYSHRQHRQSIPAAEIVNDVATLFNSIYPSVVKATKYSVEQLGMGALRVLLRGKAPELYSELKQD